MERNYPLDPNVYTPEEINERLAVGDNFIKEVIEQGEVMCRHFLQIIFCRVIDGGDGQIGFNHTGALRTPCNHVTVAVVNVIGLGELFRDQGREGWAAGDRQGGRGCAGRRVRISVRQVECREEEGDQQ